MCIRDRLVYGFASYFFTTQQRKEKDFLLYWNATLIVLYLFLFYTNPKIAYRILAYLYQSAYVIGACAFVRDFLERRSSNLFKPLRKKLAAIVLLSALLFASFYPLYAQPSTPDGVFLQDATLQKPYFDLATWVNSNYTSDSAFAAVVNNCSGISDPVNILRDMGVTMIVGINMTRQDYELINSTWTNAFILETPQYIPGIDCQNASVVYSHQLSNVTNYLKLYKLSSVLESSG